MNGKKRLFGVVDDKYGLKPHESIWGPILAAVCILMAGIRVGTITNPFGGLITFVGWIGIVVTFLWLVGMMYTTKFLDGLDGLVSGIGGIGGLIIFFLSITAISNQPETALISIIFAASCIGFLVFNFNPAKIFLGEGGSLFIGFMLGSLAIVSGGKIATTLLILGIPLLDAVWVVLRRIIVEKKSPFKGKIFYKFFHETSTMIEMTRESMNDLIL